MSGTGGSAQGVGVCLGGGGMYPSMQSGRYQPVNTFTDRCKNITLPQTSFATVTMGNMMNCGAKFITSSDQSANLKSTILAYMYMLAKSSLQ